MTESQEEDHYRILLSNHENITDVLYSHAPKFEYDGVPLIWIKNAPIKTFFEIYLSFVLPSLELFMIDTIKEIMPEIHDKVLANTLDVFCQQEKRHAEFHEQFDLKLKELGVEIGELPKCIHDMKQRLYNLPINTRLQIIAFFEAITSGLAHEIVGKRFKKEEWHPKVKKLYHWHCVEEYEHRCAAYNAYMYIVKNHDPQFLVIARAVMPMWYYFGEFLLVNLRKNKLLWTRHTLKDTFWMAFQGPAFFFLRTLINFLKKGYNPKTLFLNKELEQMVLDWEKGYHES